MKLILAAISLVLFAPLAFGADAGVLGFQAWKDSRVEEAKQALERLSGGEREATPGRLNDKKSSGKPSARLQANPKSGRGDQKLQQAQLNLEIAQEFTVNDYFVLYLSQFKQKESFIEAAKKLSPDESAELMMSYQKRLNGEGESFTSAGLPGLSSIR